MTHVRYRVCLDCKQDMVARHAYTNDHLDDRGLTVVHRARGLCDPCYQRHKAAKTLDRFVKCYGGPKRAPAITAPRLVRKERAAAYGDETWPAEAACYGQDPTRWDLEPHRQETQEQWRERITDAAVVCRRQCPVQYECLAGALTRKDYGVIRAGHAITDKGALRTPETITWRAPTDAT